MAVVATARGSVTNADRDPLTFAILQRRMAA